MTKLCFLVIDILLAELSVICSPPIAKRTDGIEIEHDAGEIGTTIATLYASKDNANLHSVPILNLRHRFRSTRY